MKILRPFNWLVCILVLLFLSGTGLASENSRVTLKIIHINDLHGHLQPSKGKTMTGGAAWFGAMLHRERSANPEGSIVLAAGDMFQGTPISNVFRGKPVTEIMNYLGFEAMELGNHEFDWGWPELMKIKAQAGFPYLAANLAHKDGSEVPGIRKLVFLEKKGMKIAVIGIIAPETAFTTNPKNVKGFRFREPEKVLPALIGAARKSGAKLVIALSHCGFDRDRAIAQRVQGIDVIVGGHSHTAVTPPFASNKTIIVQAGSWGNYLGVLNLEVDVASGRVLKYSQDNLKQVIASADAPFDEKIDAIVKKYNEKIKKEFSRVVGETRTDLLRSAGSESNLGDLICDAMRKEVPAQVAFYNSGGIRADIYKGKVRLEQAFEALPFDNLVVAMDLKGAQIKDILEHSAAREFGILQVSGARVKINPANTGGNRVVEILIDGRKLDPDRTYRIVTNDFLAAGGDRYTSFKQGKNIVYGDEVRDTFIRYLGKNSPVNPRVEGRISIVE